MPVPAPKFDYFREQKQPEILTPQLSQQIAMPPQKPFQQQPFQQQPFQQQPFQQQPYPSLFHQQFEPPPPQYQQGSVPEWSKIGL